MFSEKKVFKLFYSHHFKQKHRVWSFYIPSPSQHLIIIWRSLYSLVPTDNGTNHPVTTVYDRL